MNHFIFVAKNGLDSNLGTIDSPFLTLNRAKEEINALKLANKELQSITVYLREGKYNLSETFEVTQKDGGNDNLKVVFSAYQNEEVVVSGGVKLDLSKFSLVEDEEHLAYLHESAKGKVYSADLSNWEYKELLHSEYDNEPQDMVDRNCPFSTDVSSLDYKNLYPIITANGYVLQQAQFPNKGYCNITKVSDKGTTTRSLKPGEVLEKHSYENPLGGEFVIHEKFDIEKWQKELARNNEVYCDGHFSNDWYTDANYLGKVDDTGSLKLLKPTRYGVWKEEILTRRICFKNLLCELDQEGEWYFDKKEERLYIIPIKLKDTNVYEYETPGYAKNLFKINNAKNVLIENITFECAKESGVQIEGGENNTVAGCTFRNMAEYGCLIDGGYNNGIISSNLFDCNQAVRVAGGDIATLTQCKNYVENCDIHHCRLRGYGVIVARGCGIYIRHNKLHDMNCSLVIKTAECLVELNEFYKIGREMGDFNSCYVAVEFYTVGNCFKNNFIHHMMNYKNIHQLGALRCDDGGLGTGFVGNVFYKTGAHGVSAFGSMTTVNNNIAIETPNLWYTYARGEKTVANCWNRIARYRAGEMYAGDKDDLYFRFEQLFGEKGWQKEPWVSKYPNLTDTLNTNPWAQTHGEHVHNYTTGDVETTTKVVGENDINMVINAVDKFEYPVHIDMEWFENPENLNFKVKDGFKYMDGFEPIPFEKIGLYNDEYRTENIDKDSYRNKVYLEHKDDHLSDKNDYKIETANDIFETPKYLL